MCVWYRGERHTTKCEERQQHVSVQLSGTMAGAAHANDGAAALELQSSGQAASSGEPVFNAATIWIYSDSEGEEAEDSAQAATAGGELIPIPMDVISESEPQTGATGAAEAASSSALPTDTRGGYGGSSGNAGLRTFPSVRGSAILAGFEEADVDLEAMD